MPWTAATFLKADTLACLPCETRQTAHSLSLQAVSATLQHGDRHCTWHCEAREACVVPGRGLQKGGEARVMQMVQPSALGVAPVCCNQKVIIEGHGCVCSISEDCMALVPVHAVDAVLEVQADPAGQLSHVRLNTAS